jgi:hypothetical protein
VSRVRLWARSERTEPERRRRHPLHREQLSELAGVDVRGSKNGLAGAGVIDLRREDLRSNRYRGEREAEKQNGGKPTTMHEAIIVGFPPFWNRLD